VLPDTAAARSAAPATGGIAVRTEGAATAVAPAPAVGAEGRPSGRLTAYGSSGEPVRRAPQRPAASPRKIVPRMYPVFVPRRPDPAATDRLPLEGRDGGGR
jgi:hypothetical protein